MPALLESEAVNLLEQTHIQCPPYMVATSPEEAVAALDQLQKPLVMKILSPDILHKSDVGGVKIGLKDAGMVADAYKNMMAEVAAKNSSARLKGVILYPQVDEGLEVIIGVTRDISFGPVIMFGLGGIFVEVVKDIVFRAVPITKNDARQMISEIKNLSVLKGWRGHKPVNLEMLADLLCKVSHLILDHPEIEEMDLNPVRILEDGRMIVLDAKIVCR